MARYKSKGLRGIWNENNMKLAISSVKSGAMKVSTAAKTYEVPRRTLRRYLLERKEAKSKLGRKPLLSAAAERELASRIVRLSDVGYPLTPRVLRACVKRYCESNNIKSANKTEMIGRDWLRGFLNRQKNIRRRKAQNLNPARAQKLNKTVVSDYFTKLKKVMEENNVLNTPERIYNIDEKGCQLKLHKTPTVLAECGAKRVHLVAPEHAENVTVVSCGNALGHAIPPMLLFKGKRIKAEWLDSLPTGAVGQMTPKGSMTAQAFVNWIHHFSKFKLPGPCLLIFDGAKCHLDDSIVEAASQFDIKLFCLPSNTTHELQPMDKSVFRAFEYYWDEEVLKYWALHHDRRITKQRFGGIFAKVWDKALTPANIKAGFEATGIYPFDPTMIPEEAYAPSIPTYRPAPIASNDCAEENSSPAQANADSNSIECAEESSSLAQPSSNECTIENWSRTQPSTYTTSNDAVADAELYDSEDDIPLCNLRQRIESKSPTQLNITLHEINTSTIHQILPTPEKVSSPSTAPRKKAVNSLALELTKTTFSNNDNLPGQSRKNPQDKKSKNSTVAKTSNRQGKKDKSVSQTPSWYCFICDQDRVADMRLCIKCGRYVHEECVGLTSKDKENFICIKCE